MTKQDLEALELKIKIYKEELGSLIDKVAIKRTELSTIAKTKLEDVNKEIISRNEKLLSLNDSLSEKNKELEVLSSEIKRLNDSSFINYQKYCEKKDNEVNALKAELKEKIRLLDKQKEEADVYLKSEKMSLKSEVDKATKKQIVCDDTVKEYNDLKSKLDNERKKLELDILSFNKKVEDKEKQLSSERESLNLKIVDLNNIKKFNELKEKEISDKIKALSDLEKKIEDFEKEKEEVSRRREEANKLKVENMAEHNRLIKKSSILDSRESELNKRESNIKVLEDKLAK